MARHTALNSTLAVGTSIEPASTVCARTVLLCPGQGAQYVGMGHEWAREHPAARRTFEQADDVLEWPLSRLCFEGPEDRLNRTDVAQVAIYVTSVAVLGALREQGRIDQLAATAGLSLGEFTALHLAGAYDFITGLKLVELRGQAMQEAAESRASSMVAVIADDENQVQQLCLSVLDRASPQEQILVPANFNCPRQIVLSGTREACELTLVVAAEMGIVAKALSVAGAFHSPIMASAAMRLAKALDRTTWSEPTVPVMSNVTGRPHDAANVESIKGLLVEQLTRPVLWEASMRWLTENFPGVDDRPYVELEPGNVLTGLMRRIDRKSRIQRLTV